MSTLLGLGCLRSSPSLASALRREARSSSTTTTTTTTALLAPIFGVGGPAPILPSRRHSNTRRSPSLAFPPPRRSTAQIGLGQQQQKRTLFNRRTHGVITHYVQLPPSYRDEEGLPFRRGGDLDQEAAVAIFRGMTSMTTARANRLLRIMHGRRVAGTLDDPSLRKNTAAFSPREIKAALDYLRTEVPVDEIVNAGLRAEDELRELEADLAAPNNDKTTQPPTTTTMPSQAAHGNNNNDKKASDPRSVYGESVLDRIRAANIARREAEEARLAEERRRADEAAAQNWGALTTAPYDPALHRGLHPKQLEHYQAATSDLEAPPDVARWRVLLPTTAFVAAVLAALYLLVDRVAPPQPSDDVDDRANNSFSSEARAVAGGILLLNLAVFVAWRRVRMWKVLNRHFVLDFVTPRPHQILTAMFTHQDPKHLLKAMGWMAAGAALLVPEIGPAPFAAVYLASGVCGFLATMWTRIVARRELVYMFGASSAGFGVVCAYFWLYRFDGFKILGLPPDPSHGVQGLGFIGLLVSFFALVPLARGQGGGVDWMSHLGGMLTGIGCAALMEPRWREARAARKLAEAEVEAEARAAVEGEGEGKGAGEAEDKPAKKGWRDMLGFSRS